jgi:hypothetical protein
MAAFIPQTDSEEKIFLHRRRRKGPPAAPDPRLTPLKRFPPGTKSDMILSGKESLVSILAGGQEN